MSTEQWILYVVGILVSIGGTVWATIKYILPQIVEAKIAALADEREHRQDIEDRQWDMEAQVRATRELRRIQVDNQALAIAQENIQWAREDFSKMQEEIRQLSKILGQNRENILTLAHEISHLSEEIKRLTNEIKRQDDLDGSKTQEFK